MISFSLIFVEDLDAATSVATHNNVDKVHNIHTDDFPTMDRWPHFTLSLCLHVTCWVCVEMKGFNILMSTSFDIVAMNASAQVFLLLSSYVLIVTADAADTVSGCYELGILLQRNLRGGSSTYSFPKVLTCSSSIGRSRQPKIRSSVGFSRQRMARGRYLWQAHGPIKIVDSRP